MSWLAINKTTGSNRASDTIGVGSDDSILATGSFVFDFDFSLLRKAPSRLVHFHSDSGWQRRFTIFLNADYSISVETQQGTSHSYATIKTAGLSEAGLLRLTYTWDAPKKVGMLTVEQISKGFIHQVATREPVPFPTEDALKIVQASNEIQFDQRLLSIALNDKVVPIGPAASISLGTMVSTTDGPRAIERLRVGDMVQTKNSGPLPVRAIVMQDLPAMGHTTPVVVRAPYFGLDKDIVVARDQRILFTGFEAEYNLGVNAALLEAHHFFDHLAASRVEEKRSTIFFQLLIDTHECIQISGAWVDSLFVGNLKKFPEILASTSLSEIPLAVVPIHKSRAFAYLHEYEKRVLLESLSA